MTAATLVAVTVVVVALAVAWVALSPGGAARRVFAGVLIGLVIAGAALLLASRIRRRWTSADPEAERRAASIVLGAGERGDLTASFVIEVDQVVRNLNTRSMRGFSA